MKRRNLLALAGVLLFAFVMVFVTKANHKPRTTGLYYLKTGTYFLITSTIPSQFGSTGTIQAKLPDKSTGTNYTLYLDDAGTAAYFTP